MLRNNLSHIFIRYKKTASLQIISFKKYCLTANLNNFFSNISFPHIITKVYGVKQDLICLQLFYYCKNLTAKIRQVPLIFFLHCLLEVFGKNSFRKKVLCVTWLVYAGKLCTWHILPPRNCVIFTWHIFAWLITN